MQTVAFIVSDYPPTLGGIARYTGDVVLFLSKIMNVHVYVCTDEAPPTWPPHPCSGTLRLNDLHHRADNVARRLKADGVTQVLFNHIDLIRPATLATFRRHGLDVSCFFYGADISFRRSMRMHFRMYLICAMLKHRIVISEGTRAIFRKKFPALSTRMIHPGINLRESSPPVLQRGEGIVAVGRLVRRKGFDVLLDALVAMGGDTQNPRLTIIGDGPDAGWLRQRARELGVEKHVNFLSGLDDEALRDEVRRHRVFCLLPRSLGDGDIEGFGIVFLEAAREGRPVVAGRSGGVPDAVADGQNGFLVNPEDPREIADRLRKLLTDDALWDRFSRGGDEWHRKFAWINRDPAREFAFLCPHG